MTWADRLRALRMDPDSVARVARLPAPAPGRHRLLHRRYGHLRRDPLPGLRPDRLQLRVLVGPLIGGLLVAYVGIGWCFVVQTIPETMRGRLAGIEMLSYSVGPLGGQVRAGLTADLWSARAKRRLNEPR